MSLYITFMETRPILCQHCGKKVQDEIISSQGSWGKEWYQLLELIGCCIPEEWCDKEVFLTKEQIETICWFITKNNGIHNRNGIMGLIARALMLKNRVVLLIEC